MASCKQTYTKQKKTEYMIIGSQQHISNIITDPKIELGKSVIKRVNKSKTLGTIIDEQKLQNRAARIITGRTYDVSSDDVLKELNWEPLNQRYKINKTIFMHKVCNDKMPSSLTNLFKIKTSDGYDLQSNNNNYVLGKPKTNYEKKLCLLSCLALEWLSSTTKEKGISLNKF